jgi:hypothetical protein
MITFKIFVADIRIVVTVYGVCILGDATPRRQGSLNPNCMEQVYICSKFFHQILGFCHTFEFYAHLMVSFAVTNLQ